MKLVGLIPAAGLSRRMGRPKLTLQIGDRTVIERVLDALHAGGVPQTLVVAGPQGAETLAPIIEPRSFAALMRLADETADMKATAEAGVRELKRRAAESGQTPNGVVFTPGDVPALGSELVERLVTAFANEPDKIHVPSASVEQTVKRGHPVVWPWRILAGEIGAIPPDRGLDFLLERNLGCVVDVAARPEELASDMDLPEDYERLKASIEGEPQKG